MIPLAPALPPVHAAAVAVMHRVLAERAGRQLVRDGGFESPGFWQPYGAGFIRTHAGAHTGAYGIQCLNLAPGAGRGASQTLLLNQAAPAPIAVSGWSRCREVSGGPDSDYSLYVDLTYADGTPLWGQVAPFQTGSHGWERASTVILPARPVKSLNVYALFRNHTGTAWFDDVSVSSLDRSTGIGFFDGAAVKPAPAKPLPHGAMVTVGGNRFRVELDRATGTPRRLWYGGLPLDLQPAASGGLLVQDAGNRSDFLAVRDPLRRGPGGAIVQDAAVPSLRLRLHVTYRGFSDHTEIAGIVQDTSGRDRAITVYYTLPVPPRHLTWWSSLRRSTPIGPDGVYGSTASAGVGSSGQISTVPFAAVQTGSAANGAVLALGLPMDSPRAARLVYDASAGQFYAAFDLGITHPGPAATFRLELYATSPAEGSRGALAAYYRFFPEDFVKRVRRQGIWMPFSPISAVQHPEDFGFAFKEGDSELAYDAAHGIQTFRYTEPMSWWMTIPPGVKRDYTVALDYLGRYASGTIGDATTKQYARATRRSGDFDLDGRYHVSIVDAPWAHGALFINNTNPAIPDTPDSPNRAHVAWNPAIIHSLYDHAAPTLSGEYLDSLEGWADTHNFRREQFQYETESLTYDTATGRPCILQGVSTYEFARWMAATVHRRGKLMFANSTPWRFFWFGSVLDIMGTETNWLSGGTYAPESDDIMLYRRLVSDQRPYLLLMNTDFDQFDHAMVEKYFQRALFYGIFPSMFSHNAADNPYWQNPAWYNRDRDLFRKYIPLVRRVAEMGWEPVTRARSTDPGVWLERFGGEHGAIAAFTVLNSSSSPKIASVTFTGPERSFTAVTDLVTGRRFPVGHRGTAAEVRLPLAGQAVAVLVPAR